MPLQLCIQIHKCSFVLFTWFATHLNMWVTKIVNKWQPALSKHINPLLKRRLYWRLMSLNIDGISSSLILPNHDADIGIMSLLCLSIQKLSEEQSTPPMPLNH